MYIAHHAGEGEARVQVRWDWLPFFISSDAAARARLLRALGDKFRDRKWPDTEEDQDDYLEDVHDFVVEWLDNEFPAYYGLGQYINALKQVKRLLGEESDGSED